MAEYRCRFPQLWRPDWFGSKLTFRVAWCPVAITGSRSYSSGQLLPGWALCPVTCVRRYACIVSHVLKNAGVQGGTGSRSCWTQPWSCSPTFLLTHLHQAGLSNLKEEGLVFLILLIINYLDCNCFAETEKNRNWRTGEEACKGTQAGGKQGQRSHREHSSLPRATELTWAKGSCQH